jgi:hypothetical protein
MRKMLYIIFIVLFSLTKISCSKKEDNDGSSSSSTNSYIHPVTGGVIGSYTCAEVESDSEIFEIFKLGTTNCNLYCEKSSGKMTNSECHSAWKNGETNLNYQFMAKSWTPLNTVHNDSEVYLYNFTPVDYENVSLSDNNGTFKSNIQIKAWNRIKYKHNVSGDNVSVTIPTSNNPIMSKFANIKTKWKWAPHNYDPDQTHANWWTNITGAALRAYYILNYNMAYFLSTDSFASIIDNSTIQLEGADVKWYNSSWETYDNNSVIVTRMRDIDAIFRIGVVHMGVPSGLGGGDVHGVAPHVLSDSMRSSEWNNKIRNNFASIWFHEFAHCFGFGHNSNMTYAQSEPYNVDISGLVQNAIVDAYKANNDDPLIAPGNGQDGIDCWNNLAGIECSNSRNNINIKRYWHLTDDIIANY